MVWGRGGRERVGLERNRGGASFGLPCVLGHQRPENLGFWFLWSLCFRIDKPVRRKTDICHPTGGPSLSTKDPRGTRLGLGEGAAQQLSISLLSATTY